MITTPRLKKGLGWKPDLPDQRDKAYVAAPVKLPSSVDLRSKMPPVYDQGQLGSCTANAIGAHLDFNRTLQGEKLITPSRLFIYYNERVLENSVSSDSGATMRDSIKAVVKFGACPESEWKYLVSKFADKPAAQCFTDALQFQALTYLNIRRSLNTMKSCLASGFPFVAGITVYDSFESAQVAKDGKVPLPNSNEAVLGGHAILIVGYDDKTNSFICRNSWGASWGDKGYFYMPYTYLLRSDLSASFWTLRKVE